MKRNTAKMTRGNAVEVFTSGPLLCALCEHNGLWSEYHVHCGTHTKAQSRLRYYRRASAGARRRLFERLEATCDTALLFEASRDRRRA